MTKVIIMRPYPWKCSQCREKAVQPANDAYDAVVAHDGRSYQIHIPRLAFHRCTACGFMILDDAGNREISAELRRKAELLQPEEIRRHREGLRLTQKQLADALRVAESTLSRWETGAQIQQRAFDHLLRAYFGLPAFRTFSGPANEETPAITEDASSENVSRDWLREREQDQDTMPCAGPKSHESQEYAEAMTIGDQQPTRVPTQRPKRRTTTKDKG
jgi:putative zinc finger/helix-turn-helix YgiT family protein